LVVVGDGVVEGGWWRVRWLMVAREVADGGAYGVELVEKVVRYWLLIRWGLGRLNAGGKMVEGKDVGGHHG
jgi:hypothetical protein